MTALTESDRDWLDRMWSAGELGPVPQEWRSVPASLVDRGLISANEYRSASRPLPEIESSP